mmetsp:Transcript_42623/g.59215  ORF Transcript_42623/g.59215 Transcript_42623/m.59215 type:complete len:223 (+) Transcript_42623:831-1499(+)
MGKFPDSFGRLGLWRPAGLRTLRGNFRCSSCGRIHAEEAERDCPRILCDSIDLQHRLSPCPSHIKSAIDDTLEISQWAGRRILIPGPCVLGAVECNGCAHKDLRLLGARHSRRPCERPRFGLLPRNRSVGAGSAGARGGDGRLHCHARVLFDGSHPPLLPQHIGIVRGWCCRCTTTFWGGPDGQSLDGAADTVRQHDRAAAASARVGSGRGDCFGNALLPWA